MLERFKERWPRFRPLLIPLAIYLALLAGVVLILDAYPDSPWRYLIVLTPMIPGAFIAVRLVKLTRQLDELSRKVIYESIAITFAITLFLLLALGLLEMAGMPRLSSLYIGGFMLAVWMVAKLILSRRYE